MRVIGVISDTHGALPESYEVFFRGCDEIWHAGDIGTLEVLNKLKETAKVRAVWGNIDGQDIRLETKEHLFFELEDQRIFVRHILGYPGKYEKAVLPLLLNLKPTMVVAGHSHILSIIKDVEHSWLYLNPGAAGKYGFHLKRTMVKFVLDEGKIFDLEVWEKNK